MTFARLQASAAPVATVKAAPLPAAVLRRKCACDSEQSCETCGAGPTLRRRAAGAGPPQAPAIVHEVLRSPGRPLDAASRQLFEPRFGHDFSHVRVHDDARAAESARSVNALAYTVGRHIAFAPDRYSPHGAAGQALLAHELAHVAQNGGSEAGSGGSLPIEAPASPAEQQADSLAARAVAGLDAALGPGSAGPRLFRVWHQPRPNDCTDIDPDLWLEKVVVEQEQPQFVTLYWSDGHMETSGCSTGKGHCCTESGEGVTCDKQRSRSNDTNCTPISNGAEFSISERKHQHNGWNYWNTFFPARGIALHEHNAVNSTPLSHGCVRLPLDTARHIFCGAKRNQTKVEVRGFARPDCKNPRLKQEWQADIAGTAERGRDGDDYRRIIRDGYGRNLTDNERSEVAAGTSKLPIPPRCPSARTAPLPTAEETRAHPEAQGGPTLVPDPARPNRQAIVPGRIDPSVPQQLRAGSRFEDRIPVFIAALAVARNLTGATTVVRRHGRALWTAATARVQGTPANTDDRPLYWARLAMTQALRSYQPAWTLRASDRSALVDTFEQASRGMDAVSFGTAAGVKRILISGFDPFGLSFIGRGNPSGAAALALDGQTLSNGGVDARVEAVIFPVRFADFDAGIVENLFRPFLAGARRVDMIMTISQGGSSDFEVEELAGRRRTNTAGALDNLDRRGDGQAPGAPGASTTIVPPGLAPGPEFLRTTLPPAVRSSLRSTPLPGETTFTEIPQGSTTPRTRTSGAPTPGSTAVEGSGGNYLSNEIFYRTRLLRDATGSTVPMGHLHTPVLPPPIQTTPARFIALRAIIVSQIRQILIDTIPSL